MIFSLLYVFSHMLIAYDMCPKQSVHMNHFIHIFLPTLKKVWCPLQGNIRQLKMEHLRWGWKNKKRADLLRSRRGDSGQREQLKVQRSWGGSTGGGSQVKVGCFRKARDRNLPASESLGKLVETEHWPSVVTWNPEGVIQDSAISNQQQQMSPMHSVF